MAMVSARFFSLFPLLLHSRSSSSLHLFRRLSLRHCGPHLILSPPNPVSPFLSPLRSSHHSSLQSQPLNWEETPSQFPEPHGVCDPTKASHPWPEWLDFVNWVSTSGFCNGSVHAHEFVQDLPLDFVKIANACLDFSRQHPNLLWSLPREDIEVVIYFGSPYLFKDALGATRRMKSFLGSGLNDVLESDKPSTVDLMRFLLSYAHMAFFSSQNKPINSKVESCVRKLFGELVNSRGLYADSNASVQNQFAERYGQAPRSLGKKIEMKRGDWICLRCSFVNFSKNLKCRECEEPRPKKQLTGGEWECPQCNFFNFSRNAVCLRCDCKKAEQNPSQSPSPVLALGSRNSSVKDNMEIRPSGAVQKQQEWLSKITQLENSSDMSGSIEISEYLDEVLNQKSTTDMSSIDMGLNDTSTPVREELDKSASEMENEEEIEEPEKSERWFRKVSEVYNGDDKDFPEIMPMRKGENRFVVSKKKDRSLTSPMYKRRMAMEQKSGNNNKYVPFVPFPPDYFSKEDKPKEKEGLDYRASLPDNNNTMSNSGMEDTVETQKSSDLGERRTENESLGRGRKSLEGSAVTEPDPLDMSEEAKAERWFRRVAQIKDISELSQIPDEDFPSIMPMRKGVNRFVVSKRKSPLERRLTSSQYRRNLPVVNSDTVKKETDSN